MSAPATTQKTVMPPVLRNKSTSTPAATTCSAKPRMRSVGLRSLIADLEQTLFFAYAPSVAGRQKALFAGASGLCPETRRRASVAGGENFLRWRFRLVSQADKRALFAGASGVCRERTKGPLRLRFRLGCG